MSCLQYTPVVSLKRLVAAVCQSLCCPVASRFLAKHTSEDNASFAELLAAMNKRRRAAADSRNPPHLQVQ